MKKGYKKRQFRGVIYKISCNNHYLFGSTLDFSKRRYEYLQKLRINKYSNQILQACFNKYGEESIKFEIIQENIPEEILLFVEDIYMGANNSLNIDNPNNGMNLKSASRPTTSQITRDKISKAGKGRKLSEETKQKMKGRIPWNKGLKNCFTEEQKIQISNKLKDYFKENPEAKNKVVENGKVNYRKVIDTSTNIIYDSIKDASRKLKINRNTLTSYLRGTTPNKTTIKYLNNQ